MDSNPKVPLERRRRNNLWESMIGVFRNSRVPPMRRESDMVRSRMQRWVELADRALKKSPPNTGTSKTYPPEPRNNKN
jgi:hypothetical protein